MSCIHFTDEQKRQANAVDLVEFLRFKGEPFTHSGRELRTERSHWIVTYSLPLSGWGLSTRTRAATTPCSRAKAGTARPATPTSGSTNSKGKSFRMTVEGSDFQYAFNWPGSSGHLLVFEAPIDMLSFISMQYKNPKSKPYKSCYYTGSGRAGLHDNLRINVPLVGHLHRTVRFRLPEQGREQPVPPDGGAALMTPDELKSIPKGKFVVMKITPFRMVFIMRDYMGRNIFHVNFNNAEEKEMPIKQRNAENKRANLKIIGILF